ncbi:MAG: hypothetical protein CM15mP12_7720 [Gammaproteobacteria bacterium]|nr:MAG: hypothetical protein CM15mP12_7720 [Gammaproteobacteria bacterium]
MFLEHGLAVPFAHRQKMDEWRNNFKGIRRRDESEGYNWGSADDIWQKA